MLLGRPLMLYTGFLYDKGMCRYLGVAGGACDPGRDPGQLAGHPGVDPGGRGLGGVGGGRPHAANE